MYAGAGESEGNFVLARYKGSDESAGVSLPWLDLPAISLLDFVLVGDPGKRPTAALLSQRITNLATLPPGITDGDAAISPAYADARAEISRLRIELSGLKKELALERATPNGVSKTDDARTDQASPSRSNGTEASTAMKNSSPWLNVLRAVMPNRSPTSRVTPIKTTSQPDRP